MKHVSQSLSLAVLTLGVFLLVGCGGSGRSAGVVYADNPPPVNYTPELYSFDLFDSYDVDTRVDSVTPLALSPFYYEGLFDIFWQANSLENYHLELRLNDRPSSYNSLLIHHEICGEGLWCDQAGSLICEYTSDLFMACESEPLVDVSPLIQTLPQELYLILQVCDINSSWCEFDYYPVWME
jgi:hypothetical protein